MKHIKYFSSINESYQDGVEIIDAIRNTPEGRDLQKLLMTYGLEFESVFELKRSGRVYLIGYGSKTYMERTDRGDYVITSLSNGVPFWTERYTTIQQLLREAFINHVSKRMTGSGIKKEAVREWISGNITPGSEMDLDQIKGMYDSSTGVEYLTIEEVRDTPVIQKLYHIFPRFRFDILNGKVPYAVISIDLGDSFLGNVCGYRYSHNNQGSIVKINMRILPQSNTGKNSLSLDNGDIKLKKSEELNSVLSKYISRYIRYLIPQIEQSTYMFDDSTPKECFINGLIVSLIEGGDITDVRSSVENYLEDMVTKNNILFSKVMTELGKIDHPELNDIYKRLSKKYWSIIKGGNILRRFGSNFT